MNGRGVRDVGLRRPRPEPDGDLLQRVARFDLRVPPAIDKPPGAQSSTRPRRCPFHPQPIQPRAIEGLQRQQVLKPGVGRRIDLPGANERAVALQSGTVALEAQRP